METATQTLHRLTSYQPGRDWDEAIDDPRIVQGLQANDMSRLPWFIKRYAERAAVTPLPRELPVTTEPAVAVLAGTAEVKPSPLDLPNLSRLLYLSAGVVRIMERDFGIHPFRAAGSAGGRFPLELYVAVPSGGALPPGVHWYDPLEHVLVQVGPAWDRGRPVRGPAQPARRWRASSPRSSPSPPPTWAGSATRSTATRSWPPGWPKAGCIWPPTRWAPAHPG